jgi:hypothetical protein
MIQGLLRGVYIVQMGFGGPNVPTVIVRSVPFP